MAGIFDLVLEVVSLLTPAFNKLFGSSLTLTIFIVSDNFFKIGCLRAYKFIFFQKRVGNRIKAISNARFKAMREERRDKE